MCVYIYICTCYIRYTEGKKMYTIILLNIFIKRTCTKIFYKKKKEYHFNFPNKNTLRIKYEMLPNLILF